MLDNVYVYASLGVVVLVGIIVMIWMMQGHASEDARVKPRRFCPLCKSELGEKETLKGLIVDTNPPQKIMIRGCSKCAPATEEGTW